jgi:hypothetical protein
MRLWSIHPQYLDSKGLVALWREALLAKKVLDGKTKGYNNHPQLMRFRRYKAPLEAISSYLYYIYHEARKRNYCFDCKKIPQGKILRHKLPVTSGQVKFEFNHLLSKLKNRDPKQYKLLFKIKKEPIKLNPLFYQIPGKIEAWEKISKPIKGRK